MGDVSKHFNRSEFACSDNCGFDAVDIQLLEWMEKIREKFGVVIVHCACRCIKKNREVGSKDSSQHLKAKAIDFHIKNLESYDDNSVVAYWINNKICPNNGGIGIYEWGIHLDNRIDRIRWDNRNG